MISETASLRSYAPSPRPDKPISCLVCSDKSFGNNFGAITCESCKAFFRRTANERDKLACPFKENCEITIATRKHCRKCRLEKCFAVGMIKEWIQSEEQLKIRRAILKERKLRREMSTSGQSIKRLKANSPFDKEGGGGIEMGCGSSSGSINSSPNSTMTNERRTPNWSSSHPREPNFDLSRVNRHLPSVSTSINSGTQSGLSVENNRHSVAQFFNKISDQNFFAHLVKANESCTLSSNSRGSGQTSPLQRSSVITFTGKSTSPSPAPALPIVSSLEQEEEDDDDEESQDDSTPETITADETTSKAALTNNDPDCLLVYQSLINKQQLKGAHETQSPSSRNLTTPFKVTIPERAPTSSTPAPRDSLSYSSALSSSLPLPNHNLSKTPATSPCKQTRNEQIERERGNSRTVSPNNLLFQLPNPRLQESARPMSLNVFHHIIDSYFTRISMRNERSMATLALNSMEETRLIELTLAYGAFNDIPIFSTTNKETALVDCYNLSVGHLISMTEKLTAYVELPIQDRSSLLRGSYADILAMRGVFLLNLNRSSWKIKGTPMEINFRMLKVFDETFYSDYYDFIKNFDDVWRSNIIINQLIVAIMLFDCNLPNLKSPEAVRLEYCAYIFLLQRYLESSYNFSETPKETVCQILAKINHLQALNENKIRFSSKDVKLNEVKIGRLETLFDPD